jgi:hypothetical protein
MSLAQQEMYPTADQRPAAATVLVWLDLARPRDTGQRLLGLVPASHVLSAPGNGRIDLADFGCAHRVTAVAFTPGPGCTSVTLREALDTAPSSRVAEYRISDGGFVDLFTVGWAARTAEVVFNP